MTNHVDNSPIFRFYSDFSVAKSNYFSLAQITGIVSRVPMSQLHCTLGPQEPFPIQVF